MLNDEESRQLTEKVEAAFQKAAPAPEAPAPAELPGIPVAATSYDRREGWFYQAALVNGSGTTRGTDVQRQDNRHKDVFARVARARGNQRVGAFGYWGKSTLVGATTAGVNDFRRMGVDFNLSLGEPVEIEGVRNSRLNLFGLAAWGNDDNPLGLATLAAEVDHWGGFVEADYLLTPRSLAVLRHDWVRSDDTPELERSAFTGGYSYYVRRNLKIGIEGTFDLRTGGTDTFNLIVDTVF